METINILGTTYTIDYDTEVNDSYLKDCDGYCNSVSKKIIINDFKNDPYRIGEATEDEWQEVVKRVLRHEIIHAFLNESGLEDNSDWARNEEMVDYFALQFYKIKKVFDSIGC